VAAGIIVIAVLWFVIFNPPVAKTGDIVAVYYTGTLDDGTVFDSNLNGIPLYLGKWDGYSGF
jgi:hypothetical protein